MRSYRANHNLVAVSANDKETAINTEQTLDTSMLVAIGDVLNLGHRRQDNADELTGYEEADTIYDLGKMSGGSFNFNKAQAQHFAFLFAYGLGVVSTAAGGATGYKHTITPIDNDEDGDRSLPSFTAAMRYGDTILKRRFASLFVDSISAKFDVDDWCKITAALKGTGKNTGNITEESITAAKNAASLTLAANAVHGGAGAGNAAARLDSVHRIRVELTSGVWTDVVFSAVSDATPAVITITPPGGTADNVTYKVLYRPDETAIAWCTFPARVVETPLRVAALSCTWGGTWNGSSFAGGHAMDSEIRSIEYTLNNALEVEFVPGGGDDYASRCFRPARVQAVKFNREFRDYILQQHIDDNDTFGLYIKALGEEYEAGHNYQVEIVLPKCGIISAPISVDGKRIAEAGDLKVMEDATYGSIIVMVKNMQDTYAA